MLRALQSCPLLGSHAELTLLGRGEKLSLQVAYCAQPPSPRHRNPSADGCSLPSVRSQPKIPPYCSLNTQAHCKLQKNARPAQAFTKLTAPPGYYPGTTYCLASIDYNNERQKLVGIYFTAVLAS